MPFVGDLIQLPCQTPLQNLAHHPLKQKLITNHIQQKYQTESNEKIQLTCLNSNIPRLIAITASLGLLLPVKASQIPETEGRMKNLLENVRLRDGYWRLWILVVKEKGLVWVLREKKGEKEGGW